jgi:dienelactone hydrolase
MTTQRVEYSNGKITFRGEVFWSGRRKARSPGVVVFPEAFGLNDHCRERTERLAKLGYIALAADTHGEGAVFNDMAGLRPSIQALYSDRAEWRSRANAALAALLKNPLVDPTKTAAIGFCFGGATCFELARSGASLSAIVTFHSGLLPELPTDAGRIKGKVLICHGADDPVAKKEAIETVMAELQRDKVDWQFMSFGNAAHSFTDPEADQRKTPGFAYNKQAEERSWLAMRHLFDEAFT